MSDPRNEQLTFADYEEVLADHRRLVRELDVLLNGEAGAAKQASLCDIVGQIQRETTVPFAWARGVSSPGGPWGPPEHDWECFAGDEPPDRNTGWIPLYRQAVAARKFEVMASKTDLEFVATALAHAIGGMRAVQEMAPQGTAAARYAAECEQALAIVNRTQRDETSALQEDKADLLSMAALVARLGREQTYHVPAELLKRASAVLATLADSRATRRHRGCGADCGLPAGHLGDHAPPEEPTPVIDCTACPHPDACEAAGGCYTDATPENGAGNQT